MTPAEKRLLERLAKRVEMMSAKHEETGDEKYARLAAEADSMYRAARHLFGPVGMVDPYPAGTAWGVSA